MFGPAVLHPVKFIEQAGYIVSRDTGAMILNTKN